MTVQLDWPPEVVARLSEEACRRGLSLDDYVLQTVLQRKSLNSTDSEDAQRGAREEAGQSVPEVRSEDRESEEREERVQNLFDAFDSEEIPTGVSEGAFHRENWYR